MEEERQLHDRPVFTNNTGPTDTQKDQIEITRRDALQKLLFYVCRKQHYLKQLKHLYDLERRDLWSLDECVFLNGVL